MLRSMATLNLEKIEEYREHEEGWKEGRKGGREEGKERKEKVNRI